MIKKLLNLIYEAKEEYGYIVSEKYEWIYVYFHNVYDTMNVSSKRGLQVLARGNGLIGVFLLPRLYWQKRTYVL